MTYQYIKFEQHPDHRVITLARENKGNALNGEFVAELTDALLQIENSPHLGPLLINANGKHFCTGADLAWMKEMANATQEQNSKDASALFQLMHRLDNLPVFTLASVQGSIFGGGLGVLACCDMVIATDNCQFCFSEVKLGLVPAVITPFILKVTGRKQARRWMLTAASFNSEIAKTLGLVDKVVNPERLQLEATNILAQQSANSYQAIQACKSLVQAIETSQNIEKECVTALTTIRAGEDAKGRLSRFLKTKQSDD